MNNEQIWMYEGHTNGESFWLRWGWTIELLNKHATRVKIKTPAPTHVAITRCQAERVLQWYVHAYNNLNIDLEFEDRILNDELTKMLRGGTR